MTPPHGWRIYTHLTYSHFSSSVADSANSSILQPTGKYSLNVCVQVQCKVATAFPQCWACASKLESEVAVNFAMLVDPDNSIDEASKMCFQTTTVPISGCWCLWKSCMGEWKAQGRLWVAVKETKTLQKFDDPRMSIDDWRSTMRDCRERRQPGRQIWRHTDLKRGRSWPKEEFWRRLVEVSNPTSCEKRSKERIPQLRNFEHYPQWQDVNPAALKGLRNIGSNLC